MNKRLRPTPVVLAWTSLVERLIVIACVLPSCHLLWTIVLSSWIVDIGTLPALHAWFAEWIVRPRILLISTMVFVAGFVFAPFAKNRGRICLPVLKGLSTLFVILVLCWSAIAFVALVFPIRWLGPEPSKSVPQITQGDKIKPSESTGSVPFAPPPESPKDS